MMWLTRRRQRGRLPKVAKILPICLYSIRIDTSYALLWPSPKPSRQAHLLAHLGPPPSVSNLPIGKSHRLKRISNDRSYSIERIAEEPNAFVLRNFLSNAECNAIVEKAKQKGMAKAETKSAAGSNSRQNCDVAWLGDSSLELESILVKDVCSALIQNDEIISSSNFWVEYMQVLKYSQGGLYEIHHDGCDRFLTVIYYINGVGATWFPFSRIGDVDPCDDIMTASGPAEIRQQFAEVRRGVEGASMNVGDDLRPGSHGVTVASAAMLDEEDLAMSGGRIIPISRGDALAFYNFEYVGEDNVILPRESFRALHMGLPAEDEKIIANHWFRYENWNK